MKKSIQLFAIILCVAFFFSGCTAIEVASETALVFGKVLWKAVTVGSKATSSAVKTTANIATNTKTVPLIKKGNSYYVKVRLNKRVRSVFLIDTGADSLQISQSIARRLGISPDEGEPITARIANGQLISARAVTLKDVRVGRARAKNVRAVVLDRELADSHDGLLGMSFLNEFVFKIDTDKSRLTLRKK